MKANDIDISEETRGELAPDVLKHAAQHELAAGVLKQAAQDLRRPRGATSKVERELYLDACRWLTVDECSSLFSFLNVCQSLNLAPEKVRQELIGDSSLGAVNYWTQHCTRAARRVRTSFTQLFLSERHAGMPIRHAGAEHEPMKTLSNICPRSDYREPFTIPRNPKLVAQWQRGLETTARHAQWKLHLTLARLPSAGFATVNYCQQP